MINEKSSNIRNVALLRLVTFPSVRKAVLLIHRATPVPDYSLDRKGAIVRFPVGFGVTTIAPPITRVTITLTGEEITAESHPSVKESAGWRTTAAAAVIGSDRHQVCRS